MAKSRSREPAPPPGPPKLKIPKDTAREQLTADLTRGRALEQKPQHSNYQAAKQKAEQWADFVQDRLRRIFTTEEYARDFDFAGAGVVTLVTFGGGTERHFSERLTAKLHFLEGLIERIDIIDEDDAVAHERDRDARSFYGPAAAPSQLVFIVHGRNNEAKHAAAQFLGKIGVEYCILHEQPDGGRPIIQKLLDHAQEAGFALVIVTPDDVGALAGNAPEGRARQNVILELGLFLGKLGPSKVRILRMGNVEIPSDLHGVLYIDMDPNDGWHVKLARELKHAGISFDPAKVF